MACYVCETVPLQDNVKQYPRFIKFPGGDGVMHTVDLEAEPDMELLDEINRNPANNQYLLFTRYFFTVIRKKHCEFQRNMLEQIKHR